MENKSAWIEKREDGKTVSVFRAEVVIPDGIKYGVIYMSRDGKVRMK